MAGVVGLLIPRYPPSHIPTSIPTSGEDTSLKVWYIVIIGSNKIYDVAIYP